MTIMKFKTNVKCQGCVDRIAELFTKNKEISSWEVDLTSDDKIFTVEGIKIIKVKIKRKNTLKKIKKEYHKDEFKYFFKRNINLQINDG